ncbi:MAG TPA: hypothetical protein VFH47_04410, partial [Candidatus Thermoplasmatota archaeon]|nr:hypothetical protein [Candidatus Thermoplasmatota archaeon]
ATGVFPTWPGSVLVSGESALAAGQDVRIGYRALYLGDRDLEFTHLLATPSRDRPHGCDSLR